MRCPVCQAGFRGSAECSRCGADLRPLMRVAVRSWRLRQGAREAIAAGDFAAAHSLAELAEGLQATSAGRALRLVAGWGAAAFTSSSASHPASGTSDSGGPAR